MPSSPLLCLLYTKWGFVLRGQSHTRKWRTLLEAVTVIFFCYALFTLPNSGQSRFGDSDCCELLQ